jgi:hypothetical protein
METRANSRNQSESKRRFFPRFAKHASPRCPKHPSQTMRKERQKLPTFAATGALKEGTRTVWFCKVEGCHMVALGEHSPYFGESVLELGSMDGI